MSKVGWMPKYPQIKQFFDLQSPDGNAFNIMGVMCRVMEAAGIPQSEQVKYVREATAVDYNHLLRVTKQWFDVTFHNGDSDAVVYNPSGEVICGGVIPGQKATSGLGFRVELTKRADQINPQDGA